MPACKMTEYIFCSMDAMGMYTISGYKIVYIEIRTNITTCYARIHVKL